MHEQTLCSGCGRAVPYDQSQAVPLFGSMYARRRLCPFCLQVEGGGFAFTLMGGLLVILLFVEVIFSIFQSINPGAP